MFSRNAQKPGFLTKSYKTIPVLLICNGLIFCVFGLYMFYSATTFASRATQAELTVTKVESKQDDSGPVYRPTFETVNDKGEKLQYAGNSWISPKPHEEGEVVPGLVDSTSGIIKSQAMHEWRVNSGKKFALWGAIAALVGAIYLVWKKRQLASGESAPS